MGSWHLEAQWEAGWSDRAGPRTMDRPGPRGAQGSHSSTAGREGQTRTRVRASCPCCSLPAGLRFFLRSPAEAVDIPGGLPGPSCTAAAMSLPEQQVATRSAPFPAGSKSDRGQRGSWFWAAPWQGSGLATQPCQLAREMPEQTDRSRQPRVSLGESFPSFCPASQCLCCVAS